MEIPIDVEAGISSNRSSVLVSVEFVASAMEAIARQPEACWQNRNSYAYAASCSN